MRTRVGGSSNDLWALHCKDFWSYGWSISDGLVGGGSGAGVWRRRRRRRQWQNSYNLSPPSRSRSTHTRVYVGPRSTVGRARGKRIWLALLIAFARVTVSCHTVQPFVAQPPKPFGFWWVCPVDPSPTSLFRALVRWICLCLSLSISRILSLIIYI